MSRVIVTMRDIRAAKMCSSGAREFFKRQGLDWQEFLKSGIDSEALQKTGDAMAIKVVEVARGRQQ
ncbi:MAG: hypothetical protein ACK5MR_05085 [Cumulibacter sp.]